MLRGVKAQAGFPPVNQGTALLRGQTAGFSVVMKGDFKGVYSSDFHIMCDTIHILITVSKPAPPMMRVIMSLPNAEPKSWLRIPKTVLFRDGVARQIRALRQSDRDGLKALLARCSLETLRFRFLHAIKSLSEDEFDYLMAVDGAQHVALLVIETAASEERIVAVGRYKASAENPELAEVSFLVEDERQRRGIGTVLLQELAELARQHSIRRFSADVLSDNRLMLDVFRHAGYALSGSTSYGVTHLEFSIYPE